MNTTVVDYLKRFLSEQQDEAAIPGLGVFYNSTTDAQGTPLPDGRTIILFVEKPPRSNAFVNFFGYEENITENEAGDAIESWVGEILNELKTTQKAEIPALGSFLIQDNAVAFIPSADQKQSHLPHEYGLEDFPEKSKTIAAHESESKKQPLLAKQSNSMIIWLIAAASLIVLLGGGFAAYKMNPRFAFWIEGVRYNLNRSFSSSQKAPEPIALGQDDFLNEGFESSEQMLEEDPIADPQELAPQEQPISKSEVIANSAETAKKTTLQKYKVVGGSFAIKNNAEKFSAQMKKDGFAAQLVFDEQKKLYYVILNAFDTLKKALDYKEEIRTSRAIGCWIYTE